MTDDPHDTIFPLPIWFVIAASILFGCPSASAEPQYRASVTGGAAIILHSEQCALKEVSNLPHRATWEQPGKASEGCWGHNGDGIVLIYFLSDRTIVHIPSAYFERVQGV